LTLDGHEGAIALLLRSFPRGASADHPELALAHAAVQLAKGRLEDASAQLRVAESHVEGAPPARRRRLAIASASLRLALARRGGQFAEVVEQVNLLDASIADGSNQPIMMGSELRAVALMNLGIVETWSGQFDDAERHLSDGAALAQTIGRPYLEVACRAHQFNRAPLDIAEGARSSCAHDHQIPASPSPQVGLQDACVATTPPGLYRIRIKGRLGATALSAFPTMVPEVEGSDTVLTGPLTDR